MRAILGISLTAGGAVLLWLGLRASESLASGVTRLFSGSPTKESVLLLTAGGAVIAAGLWLLLTAMLPRRKLPGLKRPRLMRAGPGRRRRARSAPRRR